MIILAVCLETHIVKEHVKSYLSHLLQEATGYPVEIRGLKLLPFFRFKAEKIILFHEKKEIILSDVKAAIDPFALLKKNLKLEASGNFQDLVPHPIHIEIETLITPARTIAINHVHASYGPFHLDGSASLAQDGSITQSSFYLRSGELKDYYPIQGHLYGEGKLSGPLLSPNGDFTIHSDRLGTQKMTLHQLNASITKEALKGGISLSFVKDFQPHYFSGILLWEEALSPLPAQLTAKASLSEAAHLLNMETSAISGDIELTLSRSDNRISGTAALTNGFFESYQLGSLINGMQAEIAFDSESNRLNLTTFFANDGRKGSYSASGFLALDPARHFPFEFHLTAEKVYFLELDFLNATATGQFAFAGSLNKAEISGSIAVEEAELNIPEQSVSRIKTIPITYINETPGKEKPIPKKRLDWGFPIDLDLFVKIPGKLKINGTSLTSEWKGEGKITGTLHSPEVNGELQIQKGKYRLRGRTLPLTKGTISFAGDFDKKASLYVIGTLQADRYTIEGIAKGPLKNPGISFRSTPPLSQKEIFSWLLFNKEISEISEFQGSQLNQSITALSDTDQGPDLLSRVGAALGLDRVDISGDANAHGLSFELGKYVTDNTYVSISRKPESNKQDEEQDLSNRLGIETNLGNHFKLQVEVDEDRAGQVNFLWKKDY